MPTLKKERKKEKEEKKREKLERIQISRLYIVLHLKVLEKQEYTISPKIKQQRLKKDRGEIEDIHMRD